MTATRISRPRCKGVSLVAVLAMTLASTTALGQTGSRVGSGAITSYTYSTGEEPSELKKIRRLLQLNRIDKAIAVARAFADRTKYSSISGDYGTTNLYRYSGLNALCVTLTAGGQTTEAIENCEAAIALMPKRWQAVNSLANAHYSAANFDVAIKNYRRAIELAPVYGRARALVEHNLELAEKKN